MKTQRAYLEQGDINTTVSISGASEKRIFRLKLRTHSIRYHLLVERPKNFELETKKKKKLLNFNFLIYQSKGGAGWLKGKARARSFFPLFFRKVVTATFGHQPVSPAIFVFG